MQRPKPIRVVIGEDTFLMREALERIMSGFDYIEAVAFCGDRDSLTAAIARERPDAVLTDIRMPPTGTDEGIQVARELRVSDPDIGVVVLSQFADPSYVLAFLDAGSARRAYLLKERVSRSAAARGRDRGGRRRRIRDRPEGGRGARARTQRRREVAAVRAHPARARRARRARPGQEQRGDRRVAGADQARGREAHQRDLHQARAREPRRRQPARQGRADVPGQREQPGFGARASASG